MLTFAALRTVVLPSCTENVTPLMAGASFTAATLTVAVVLATPPWSSVIWNVTVRAAVDGLSEALWNATCCSSMVTRLGVAALLRLICSAVPLVPSLTIVPIAVPLMLTFVPLTFKSASVRIES